jgi:hypothetical protein
MISVGRFFFMSMVLLIPLLQWNSYSQVNEADAKNGEEITSREQQKIDSEKINVDMQVLYGHYDNMLSTINLSQEKENFVYLLSSYFKRSNDFGYGKRKFENTSFYVNNVGFTSNINVKDNWKLIPEAEVDNESRGMYDNDIYHREEKDEVKLSIKNIIKFTTSFEGYVTIGGASYAHRLRAFDKVNEVQSRFDQMNLEGGGELIWSASNRVRLSGGFTQYDYSPHEFERDRFWESEIVDDFNITRNFGVSFGLNFDYHQGEDWLLFPIFAFSFKGYKYFSMVCLYRYDLVPFRPEVFYLKQKFINPAYDLPPAKVHHGELKADFRLNKIFVLKGSFLAEKSDNFYNYYSVTGNVLSAETVEVKSYITRGDANLALYKTVLVLMFSYEYSYFDADKNITYHPEQTFSNSIKYNGEKWKIEWSNKFFDKVYIDPDSEKKLHDVFIGYFDIQRKMLDSFYAYFRIENLYNSEYFLRDGYPEPGIIVFGGLRILI